MLTEEQKKEKVVEFELENDIIVPEDLKYPLSEILAKERKDRTDEDADFVDNLRWDLISEEESEEEEDDESVDDEGGKFFDFFVRKRRSGWC